MRVTEFSQTWDLFLLVARHLLNRYREFEKIYRVNFLKLQNVRKRDTHVYPPGGNYSGSWDKKQDPLSGFVDDLFVFLTTQIFFRALRPPYTKRNTHPSQKAPHPLAIPRTLERLGGGCRPFRTIFDTFYFILPLISKKIRGEIIRNKEIN